MGICTLCGGSYELAFVHGFGLVCGHCTTKVRDKRIERLRNRLPSKKLGLTRAWFIEFYEDLEDLMIVLSRVHQRPMPEVEYELAKWVTHVERLERMDLSDEVVSVDDLNKLFDSV